jgi:hypothetical protein
MPCIKQVHGDSIAVTVCLASCLRRVPCRETCLEATCHLLHMHFFAAAECANQHPVPNLVIILSGFLKAVSLSLHCLIESLDHESICAHFSAV